jgi:arylsulfatase A-like enzyme
MCFKSVLLFPLCLCVLSIAGCGKKNSTSDAPEVIRLFDVFNEEDLTGNVGLANSGWERTAWQAREMAPLDGESRSPPRLGFRAVKGASDLALDGGQVKTRLSGDCAVIQFSPAANRGGAGRLKFVDVRMHVAGASRVWLRAEGAREVQDDKVVEWADAAEWTLSADVANAAMKTYRFDVTKSGVPAVEGRPSGPPPLPGSPEFEEAERNKPSTTDATGDLRHFFLAFRDCANGSVSIDSIRFVSEKEEKLNEPSGRQWAGLSDIFRETLAAKTSEVFRFPLRSLPARPWLDVKIGTPEDSPVTFVATIAKRNGSKVSAPETLFQRTITTPGIWQNLRIDLAAYAGESVLVEFSLHGEKKGLWGYWGAPAIRNSIAAGSGTNGKKPRGVIFLVVDSLRPDHLNLYGYERETLVHLKKFAEEGTTFRHAIAQGTWTKVSQTSMVTSLYPASHNVFEFPEGLAASATTVAEVYRDAGYATVSYSSVPFTGKQGNLHQGYEELHEASFGEFTEYNSKTSRKYVDRLIPWLEQHRDVPFFVYLHVFDPHSPYKPRPPYETMWAKPEDVERIAAIDADIKKFDVKNRFGLPEKDDYVKKTGRDPAELLRIYTDWYDGSIRGMDTEIGRLLEALREMGLDEDTLIVFSSDHGEELWDHGRFFHGQTVYGELSQVPLVFRWPTNPAIRKGVWVDHVVENLDIMPTLLELSGIEGPSEMQGRSLVPLLNGTGEASWQPRLVVTQTKDEDENKVQRFQIGIIADGMKVVRKEFEPDIVEELYDPATDPLDLHNLIANDGQRARVDAITRDFATWRTEKESQRPPSDEEMTQNMSSEELRRLQALGYVGGGVRTTKDGETKAAEDHSAQPAKTDSDGH